MSDELKLKIVLDDGSVKDGFLRVEKSGSDAAKNIQGSFSGLSSGLNKSFLALGTTIAGVFATAKIANFLKDSAKAAIEAENATNALGASLGLIGKYSKEAVESFSEYAGNLQATTGIEDDLIKQNAALLVSIGKLSGDGLERGTKAALDLSQALQIDVGTAFDLVSKAASGSTGALGRYGIKIDENIPKAAKWAETLKLIETRFGGLAETRLNTLEGSLTNLGNAFGEIQEAIGGIFTDSGSLRAVINVVSKSFFELANAISSSIKGKDILKDILLILIQIGAFINSVLIAPVELFIRGFVFGLKTIKLALDTLVVVVVGFSKLLVEAIVIPIEKIVSGLGFLVSYVNKDFGNGLSNAALSFREKLTLPLAQEYENVKSIQETTFNDLANNANDVFSNKISGSIDEYLLKINDAVVQSGVAGDKLKTINNKTAADITSTYADLNAALKTQFVGGLTKTFQDVGTRLQKGEGLFDDFGNGIVGIIGDLLITIGGALLLQGLAIEAFIASITALLPGSGLAAAAAGVGLIIFGSALKAAVSKGGSSSAPATGGGIASSPGSSTELTPTQNLERQEPGTQVSVVIQGDVLDSDESGSRIVSLINSAFDKKGVVISQGAFA